MEISKCSSHVACCTPAFWESLDYTVQSCISVLCGLTNQKKKKPLPSNVCSRKLRSLLKTRPYIFPLIPLCVVPLLLGNEQGQDLTQVSFISLVFHTPGKRRFLRLSAVTDFFLPVAPYLQHGGPWHKPTVSAQVSPGRKWRWIELGIRDATVVQLIM